MPINSRLSNPVYSRKYTTVFQPDLDQHGQSYRQLAEQNPYANVTYRQSGWQQFLERLGFRTNYDKYMESMALQAKEYDNQLLQKEYNEAYDSPVEQAQREKLAGLNPNLTGNVGPGESQKPIDDGNPPIAPESDFEMVNQFASSVLSGLQAAFGLYGTIQGITSTALDNQAKKLSNTSSLTSLAQDAVLNLLPEVYSDQSGVDWLAVESLYPKLKNTYGNLMSKRQFKKFVKLTTEFQYGLNSRAKEFKTRNQRSDDRQQFYRRVSGAEGYSEVDEVMRGISGIYSDLANKLFKERTEADRLKALNDQDFQTMVVPQQNQNAKEYAEGYTGAERAANEKAMAGESLLSAQNSNKMSTWQLELRSGYKRIMDFLDEKSRNGNVFASIAQLAVSGLLLGNLTFPSLNLFH